MKEPEMTRSSFGVLVPTADVRDFSWVLGYFLRDGMRRLRLGGNDPFMVFPRAWRHTLQFFSERLTDPTQLGVIAYEGLKHLKWSHPYGRYIRYPGFDQMDEVRNENGETTGFQFVIFFNSRRSRRMRGGQ